MKQPRKQHWILAAAASAALMMSAPLFGQVRVNQDGHAADANPRVGSGGVNEGGGGGGTAYGVIPNGVVTHDITGGSFFHDRTEGDPIRFSGPVSRVSDRFIQGSSG